MCDHNNRTPMQSDGWPTSVTEDEKITLTRAAMEILSLGKPISLFQMHGVLTSRLTDAQWHRGPLLDYQYAVVERALRACGADHVWILPPVPDVEMQRVRNKDLRDAMVCPKCHGKVVRYLETLVGWREVLGVNKGRLRVEGHYEGGDGYDDEASAKSPQWECQQEGCKHRWPVPAWVRARVDFE